MFKWHGTVMSEGNFNFIKGKSGNFKNTVVQTVNVPVDVCGNHVNINNFRALQ